MAVILAFCFQMFTVDPARASASTKGTAEMRIPVSCVIGDAADPQHANQACAELMALLPASYPDQVFVSATSNDIPALTIYIRTANDSRLGVQIEWTTLTGQKTKGPPLSIVAMDTTLNPSRRQSLYRRLLAETPMPKQD